MAFVFDMPKLGSVSYTSPTIEDYVAPEYTPPAYNEDEVTSLTQQRAAPGLRSARSAMMRAIGGYYDNPNVKRMTLRDALAGYGMAVENVMGGASNTARGEYGQKHASDVNTYNTGYAARENAGRMNYNTKVNAVQTAAQMAYQSAMQKMYTEYQAQLANYMNAMYGSGRGTSTPRSSTDKGKQYDLAAMYPSNYGAASPSGGYQRGQAASNVLNSSNGAGGNSNFDLLSTVDSYFPGDSWSKDFTFDKQAIDQALPNDFWGNDIYVDNKAVDQMFPGDMWTGDAWVEGSPFGE